MRFKLPLLVASAVTAVILSASVNAETKIAVVGAMSGQFENVGKEFKQGVQVAVEKINEGGGLLGESISVFHGDDECDPEKAKIVAKEMADKGVVLVVGHLCSGASIAASEIYAEHGIVQITPASTAPQFTERGLTNVFRTCGRDDMQGFVLAEHIVRKHSTKTVGIGHDESVYSTELAKLTKHFLNKSGIEEAFFLSFPRDTADYASLLDTIAAKEVDLLFFPTYAGSATRILRQAKKQGIAFQFVGSDTLMNDDFLNQAGELTEGVELSFPPDPSHDRRNRKLAREYRKKGMRPEAFTFYNYAAVEVWAQAVRKADTTRGEDVSTALRSHTFTSVLGNVSFNDKGDISEPGFVMYGFVDGEPDYLQ